MKKYLTIIKIIIIAIIISLVNSNLDFNNVHPMIDDQELLEHLNKNHNKHETVSIVLFYLNWCGHCQRFMPVFKKLSNLFKKWPIIFYTIDFAQPQQSQYQWKIYGFPTIRLYWDIKNNNNTTKLLENRHEIIKNDKFLNKYNIQLRADQLFVLNLCRIISYLLSNNEVEYLINTWSIDDISSVPSRHVQTILILLKYCQKFSLDYIEQLILQYSYLENIPVVFLQSCVNFPLNYTINTISNTTPPNVILSESKHVTKADILGVLSYSLNNEIKINNKNDVQIILNWLELFIRCVPWPKDLLFVNNQLEHLKENIALQMNFKYDAWIQKTKDPLYSKIFKNEFPIKYSSSLWKTLHLMSQKCQRNTFIVWTTIRKYISTFFSCEECRLNFILMIKKNRLNNPINIHLSFLHNIVNQKLNKTRDYNPFPSINHCPECYKSDQLIYDHTLNVYLAKIYSEIA